FGALGHLGQNAPFALNGRLSQRAPSLPSLPLWKRLEAQIFSSPPSPRNCWGILLWKRCWKRSWKRCWKRCWKRPLQKPNLQPGHLRLLLQESDELIERHLLEIVSAAATGCHRVRLDLLVTDDQHIRNLGHLGEADARLDALPGVLRELHAEPSGLELGLDLAAVGDLLLADRDDPRLH